MKSIFLTLTGTLLILGAFVIPARSQFFKNLKNSVENRLQQRANNKADKVTDNVVDSVEGVKGSNASAPNSGQQDNNAPQANTGVAGSGQGSAGTAPPSVKSYQNYDFVPGDTVIFYDNFKDDQYGEFPAHWNLVAGQAVVDKVGDDQSLFETDGNYVLVSPRMKTVAYLSVPFTIEFDYYIKSSTQYGIDLILLDASGTSHYIEFDSHGGVSTSSFSADYPVSDQKAFDNHWHHVAFIMMGSQMKCYIDQYRILVNPDVKYIPVSLQLGGIASQDNPIIIKNVRIASGGNMNIIGEKFTASKIVTHGIHFGVDQATIEPGSMGTLNMIVNIMKNNPSLKFEVDGHTDNSGDAAHNLTLSQERADAVKSQLVSMGIDGSRLTTRGFGDTRPIDTNATPEGMANNRRVEFVKEN